jgi:hypothetical protein
VEVVLVAYRYIITIIEKKRSQDDDFHCDQRQLLLSVLSATALVAEVRRL